MKVIHLYIVCINVITGGSSILISQWTWSPSSTKSISQSVSLKLLLKQKKKNTVSYLSRFRLKYLCDLDIPLLLCSFACRQCWIQHFSIQSNELLQIPLRGFWEISRGFLPWLRWSPSLRRSPRLRKREHCCHWDSRSLLWSSLPFLAPWWKEIGYGDLEIKIKKSMKK